jgi:glycosyltransferase involved in cell wall biosynthesis
MADLSVIIPSRNERFLARTVQDILANMRGDTEVIVVLDGAWTSPPIEDHPKVHIIYHSQSIGQRAACNEAVKISNAKYVMKCDAHCAFDEGFDVKMLADMQDNWTMVPVMRNLHIFDWVCPDGHRRYQGRSGACVQCGKPTEMDVVWIAKTNPQSTSYCFDTDLHFQYFGQFKKRPEGQGDLTETMSLQGSCFLMTREKYFDLNICDESWGSWGQQGVEVSVKTWLSGGRVICNHKTFYSHMFRTSGGDFGFPYPLSGRQVSHARKMSRDLFLSNKWEKQIYPLSWLIEKFKPVPYWHDESGKEALARVTAAGASFSIINPMLSQMGGIIIPLANSASSHDFAGSGDNFGIGEKMPSLTENLSAIDNSGSIRP